METRVCISCGVDKPIDEFRPYYGGRKGRYRHCRECEAIESRRKYLARKGDLKESEQQELDNIHDLYELRVARGLQPPTRAVKTTKVTALIEQQLQNEKDRVN